MNSEDPDNKDKIWRFRNPGKDSLWSSLASFEVEDLNKPDDNSTCRYHIEQQMLILVIGTGSTGVHGLYR